MLFWPCQVDNKYVIFLVVLVKVSDKIKSILNCLVLGTKTVSEERSTETSQPPAQKSPTTEQALNNLKKPSSTSASSSSQPHSSTSLNRQSSPTQASVPNKPQSVSELAQAHLPPQPHVTMPPVAPQEDASVRKEEEPNMEHFAKAAENLVASLDDDEVISTNAWKTYFAGPQF